MNRFQMFLIIGVSALLWPVIQLPVFYLRFGLFDVQPPVLMFLPMGAIAGGFLVYWLDEAKANQKKLLTLLGCVVASPIAFYWLDWRSPDFAGAGRGDSGRRAAAYYRFVLRLPAGKSFSKERAY